MKSGGEWISSVELENEIMAHPEVRRGRGDRRARRELGRAAVRLRRAARRRRRSTPTAMLDVPRGPRGEVVAARRVVFIDEVPKTSVGKFYKKVLRARLTEPAEAS